jgi:hypothetical protein
LLLLRDGFSRRLTAATCDELAEAAALLIALLLNPALRLPEESAAEPPEDAQAKPPKAPPAKHGSPPRAAPDDTSSPPRAKTDSPPRGALGIGVLTEAQLEGGPFVLASAEAAYLGDAWTARARLVVSPVPAVVTRAGEQLERGAALVGLDGCWARNSHFPQWLGVPRWEVCLAAEAGALHWRARDTSAPSSASSPVARALTLVRFASRRGPLEAWGEAGVGATVWAPEVNVEAARVFSEGWLGRLGVGLGIVW